MSLGGGNHNGQTDSRSNFDNSRQQDQMPNQNFASDKEDLNRQFNRPPDRSDRAAGDGWSRYQSQERPGMREGGGPGYDNSKYGTRPPPSSSSTSSRPGEQGRGGNTGGMSSEGFMGRQGGSNEVKTMGNGRMGEGGGMVGMAQGYRSSGVPTSMGGSSSGAPIISEGRRGAMAASGGLSVDRGMVGSFCTSEAQTSQSWIGEQRLGGPNNLPSQISYPPPGAPMTSLASFPPPGIPNNLPPPTSRTDQGPPGGFNAGGSSVGFNTGNGSFNRPTGGHEGTGGYDSSKYGRARNKPS